MGFDVKIVTDCLKLSKKQVWEILFAIILPVTAGIAFVAPLWPSLIKDGRTLNICLLGFVVALPMLLINNLVWSMLFVSFVKRVIRVVVTSFLLSSPGLKKNELMRGRVRELFDRIFDEVPFLDGMGFAVMSYFGFRDIASVITAVGFYTTAIIVCLFEPGILISALLFLIVASLPPVCAAVLINRMSSELQTKLSKMSHREIIDQVGHFAVHYLPSDLVKDMQSYLYAFLDGDPGTHLSSILDSRLTMADSVWLEGGQIQEVQQD